MFNTVKKENALLNARGYDACRHHGRGMCGADTSVSTHLGQEIVKFMWVEFDNISQLLGSSFSGHWGCPRVQQDEQTIKP